jgi:uncharacterized membrane protein
MKKEGNEVEKICKESTDCQPTIEEKQLCNVEKHPKQDFQVERLAFFSDAVFAIAITLLIVDFKVPNITVNSTYQEVLRQLFDLKFHFLAILCSFAILATYWYNHHFLFKYIHNYNSKIIIANMFVLLPIIFFSFITNFWAESLVNLMNLRSSIENPDIYVLGFSLFFLNNFFAALAIFIFYWVAIVKYKELSFEMPMQKRIKFISDALFKVTFFGILSVVTLITHNMAFIALTMMIIFVLRKIYIKKLATKMAER